MESPVVCFLILTAITFADRVHGQRIYASENPTAVGSNLTIFSDSVVTLGGWTFNGHIIVLIYPGGYEIETPWTNRTTYNVTTSSLTITSVTLEEAGLYKLQQMNSFTVQLMLSVLVPVSNVTLSAKSTHLVEFNDMAVFTCSVSSGSSLSYQWLDGNSIVSGGGGVQLSNSNSTLTILNVTRFNQGPYRCNVSNAIGFKVSPPVNLNISYGPDNAKITVTPMKFLYRSGSNVTLSCSADSSPPAMVQWMFNETELNHYGPQLNLQDVKENNSGIYRCVFYNSVTLRFNSTTTSIQILDPVTAVVTRQHGAPAIHNEPFTLSCDVTGHVDSIHWWKDGQLLSSNNETVFGTNNKTLTLSSIQLSHGGDYQCQAFNPVSDMISSPYRVDVNYGPYMTTIIGPNVAKAGDNVTFSCSADTVPSSLFTWYFNGFLVSNTAEYVTPLLTKEMSGAYICTAVNNITGKDHTASIKLTVIDPIKNVQIAEPVSPAIEGHSFNLTCNVTGTVEYIYWMKNGELLPANIMTIFNIEHKTLMFTPVERSDDGGYQCMAGNIYGNMTSPSYKLLVNYGPYLTTITGPNVAKAGDNVTFSCSADSVPSSLFTWYFNGFLVSNMAEYVTPLLTKEMSGEYICTAVNNITGKNNTASIKLTVIEPIKNVQIAEPVSPAIEGHSFNLTCNVTGTVEYIYWMKNGELLPANIMTIFNIEHKTLMFTPVERSDDGDYQCMAGNIYGNMTSPSYKLLVNYGPYMTTIIGPNVGKAGHNVTFSCSADSVPSSLFTWYFNGFLVSNTSEYVTPLLTKEMSGAYICTAVNNITGKNNTASIMLTVIDPIQNVQIAEPVSPAIEGHPFSLVCNVTGTVEYIYWLKNGQLLPANNRINMENKTLMFTSVELSDDGDYQCMAGNVFENMTSPSYKLLVNYGPATPIIYGQAFAETESRVVFNCSAMSVPPSSITWWFNGSVVANTSEFSAGPLSLNMSGEYTCVAFNHVTGRRSTNSTTLKVIEAIKSVMTRSFTIPIDQKNFSLACYVLGPYDSIYWKKDNMYLKKNASSTNIYSFEDNMLHFTPLMINNSGAYHCVATNKAAQHQSPQYTLIVNYGPLNVQISGPDSEKQGVSVSMTCAAESQPVSDFRWFLNNQSMPLGNGSVITFLSTKNNEGKYICEAKNFVTNITMTQSKTFAVAAHASAIHFITKSGLAFMGLCALSAHWLFL